MAFLAAIFGFIGPLGKRLEGLVAGAAFVLILLDLVTALVDRRRER